MMAVRKGAGVLDILPLSKLEIYFRPGWIFFPRGSLLRVAELAGFVGVQGGRKVGGECFPPAAANA